MDSWLKPIVLLYIVLFVLGLIMMFVETMSVLLVLALVGIVVVITLAVLFYRKYGFKGILYWIGINILLGIVNIIVRSVVK